MIKDWVSGLIKDSGGITVFGSRLLFMGVTLSLVLLLSWDFAKSNTLLYTVLLFQLCLWLPVSYFVGKQSSSPLTQKVILLCDCLFVGWWCSLSGFNPWFVYFLFGISIAYLSDFGGLKFIMWVPLFYLVGALASILMVGPWLNIVGTLPINLFGVFLAIALNVYIGHMIFEQYKKAKESKENLVEINNELTQINDIATVANSTLIPDQVISSTLPLLKNLIDFDLCIIYITDTKDNNINFHSYYGDKTLDEFSLSFLKSKPINIGEKDSILSVILKGENGDVMYSLKKSTLEYGYDTILYEYLKYKEAFIFPVSIHNEVIAYAVFCCNDSKEDVYNQKQMQIFKLLRLIMIAHNNALLYQQIEADKLSYDTHNDKLTRITENLKLYLPEQIYSYVMNENTDYSMKASRKFLSVSFVEFRGLNNLLKNIEIEQFFQITNAHYNEINHIVSKYGGVLDKFIGDAVLMFWGDPKTLGAKEDALAAAKAVLELYAYFNSVKLQHEIWSNVSFAGALHCGYCTAGNFGSEHKMSYTIMGTPVNLTSRIMYCSQNNILLSKDIYTLVENEVTSLKSKKLSVKGIEGEFEVFTLDSLKISKSDEKASYTLNEQSNGFKLSLDKKIMKGNQLHDAEDVLKQARYILQKQYKNEAEEQ